MAYDYSLPGPFLAFPGVSILGSAAPLVCSRCSIVFCENLSWAFKSRISRAYLLTLFSLACFINSSHWRISSLSLALAALSYFFMLTSKPCWLTIWFWDRPSLVRGSMLLVVIICSITLSLLPISFYNWVFWVFSIWLLFSKILHCFLYSCKVCWICSTSYWMCYFWTLTLDLFVW